VARAPALRRKAHRDPMATTVKIPVQSGPDDLVAAAQLEAIKAVSAAVAQGGALPDTLDRIARVAAQLVRAQAAAIVLRERELQTGLAVAGSYGLGKKYSDHLNATSPLEIGKGPSGLAAKHGKPVPVEDVMVDPLCAPWRGLAIRRHYRSLLSVPLRLGADRVIGVLNAYRGTPGPWASYEIDLLSLLADHAAIAIRTADLLDRARRQVDGLSLMVRSLRAQAHEHSNHLHAIYGLLALGEVEETRNLIAAVEEGYHSTYGSITRRIENATISGFLVAESAIARESGIELLLDRRSRLRELPAGLEDLDAVTVLGNLIHNAVDAVSAMPRSRRRVAVALLERPSGTIFRVRDWGPGVDEANLRRIFHRDYTTKSGHSGIGLALVQSVVKRAGGSIAAERLRSGGLAVTLEFPR
jgi:signal transduction histidine kinase